MRSHILGCSCTRSLVIYPPTQHSSDRRPYLQRPEDVSETNANISGERYENVSLAGRKANVQASQGEAEGCQTVIFTGAYPTVFCCVSVRVRMLVGISMVAELSAVHLINEIVRQPWIYGGEFSHPFRPAVPGSPQGHRVPLGSHLNCLTGDPFAANRSPADDAWVGQVNQVAAALTAC